VNKIYFILFLFCINIIYAQVDYCGTDDNPASNLNDNNNSCSIHNLSNYSASIDENYLSTFSQVSLDLVIWGFEKTDGTQSINQEDAHNMTEFLNSVYGEFNICFNLIKFDHIISDEGYDGDDITNLFNTLYDGIALQIFVPNDYQYRGQARFYELKNVVRKDQIDTGILNHDVGHNLGLRHPFICERVTRDPSNPNYNADVAGDYVIDTNAAPNFYPIMNYVSEDCKTYSGNLTNCHGEQYTNLTESDLKNVMTWTFCPRIIFTTGQKITIHETLQNCSSKLFNNTINENAIDLTSKNSDLDYSIEPDNQTGVIWESPDIWVRNQSDGFIIQEDEVLKFVSNQTAVYVYVKVRNIFCDASSGEDELKLYWAKGGLSQDWPTVWEGATANGLQIGNNVGTRNIPSISAGGHTILEFEWQPVNPDIYEDAGFKKPWMFCFLSRIVSQDDPMSYPEIANVAENTRNNNNIAYKNTTVENIGLSGELGSIFVGNFNENETNRREIGRTFAGKQKKNIHNTINFFTSNNSKLFNDAEVTIYLNEDIWKLWQSCGGRSSNIRIKDANTREVILTNNYASLEGIIFKTGDWGILTPKVNFLIKELGNESDYRLYVSQTESSGHEVLGGYTYNIKRDKNRSHFKANAVSSNNGAELNALDINEEAIYNWYNENDKLISTDKKLILNNFENKEYKLEVITKSDGYKDYKHITVNSPFKIVTISPNPAPNLIHVKYQIPKNTTNTYLSITNYLGFNVNTHLLTKNSSNIKISTKGMVNGVYIISLIHGGKVIDSKQLIKK
jgi:hypothetical protein